MSSLPTAKHSLVKEAVSERSIDFFTLGDAIFAGRCSVLSSCSGSLLLDRVNDEILCLSLSMLPSLSLILLLLFVVVTLHQVSYRVWPIAVN